MAALLSGQYLYLIAAIRAGRQIVEVSMLSDEEQIRALVQTWQSASKAGDVDTVLDLMTDDVVFLVPGRPPMHKAEFAAVSRVPPGSPRPKLEGTSEIQEVQVSGDMAFIWTKLSVTVTPSGADVPSGRGTR